MKVKVCEIKNNVLETVEDMVTALLDVPKDYSLTPLGQQCAMMVNHKDECVYLDDPNWIEDYENQIQEELKEDGESFELEVEDSKLETCCLYYMWEATSETDGVYTYYQNKPAALKAFDLCESEEKTYGKAHFVDGKLEPFEVLGTTL